MKKRLSIPSYFSSALERELQLILHYYNNSVKGMRQLLYSILAEQQNAGKVT